MILYALLILAGLFGGLLAGLLGIGGGLIYILILPTICTELGVLDSNIVQFTIANSLFATTFASLSASVTHYNAGRNYIKEILITGIPAVVISVFVLLFIVNAPGYSIHYFNIFVILIMVYLLIRTLMFKSKTSLNFQESEVEWWRLSGSGIFGGILSPLSGLGGSLVIIPLLNFWARFNIKKAAAVSIGVVFIQSFLNTVVNLFEKPRQDVLPEYSIGYIILPVAMVLSISVTITSPIGVRIAQKISPKLVKRIFIFVLFSVLIKKLADLI